MDDRVSKNRPSTADIPLSPWRKHHYWPNFTGLWRREGNFSISINIIFWLGSRVSWSGYRGVYLIFLYSRPGLTVSEAFWNVVIGTNMMVNLVNWKVSWRYQTETRTDRSLFIVCVEYELLYPPTSWCPSSIHPCKVPPYCPESPPQLLCAIPRRLTAHPSPWPPYSPLLALLPPCSILARLLVCAPVSETTHFSVFTQVSAPL